MFHHQIYEHLMIHNEGRLIYAGAGTSGRIGVQDGVELFPTFNWFSLFSKDISSEPKLSSVSETSLKVKFAVFPKSFLILLGSGAGAKKRLYNINTAADNDIAAIIFLVSMIIFFL